MDLKGVAAATDAANPEPGTYFPPLQFQEVGTLALPLNDSTDDTVALENAPQTAVVSGNLLRIDQEEMSVTDATDQHNLIVTRGANSTPLQAHAAGARVLIGVQ